MCRGGLKQSLVLVLALAACSGSDKKKVNSPCQSNTDCADSICHLGVCAAGQPAALGQKCAGPGECRSFRCETEICREGKGTLGTDCLYDEECESQRCLGGKCAAKEYDARVDGGRRDGGAADGLGKSDGAGACPTSKPLKSDITTATTLDGCYLVEATIDVSAELTIAPGSVLVFKKGTTLIITASGTLKAVGTAAKPILFTGEQKVRGHWGGVVIANSTAANELQHATIEYGGSTAPSFGQKANLALTTSSSSTAVNASISNCTLRESAGYGFFLSDRATVPSFASNTITLNELGAGYVGDDSAGLLDKSSTFKGNTVDMVWVAASTLEKSRTWPAIDVRYVVSGTLAINQTPGVTLTIEAGATLAFQAGAGIEVSGEGALSAKGSASAPVTFTQSSATNRWRGLVFWNANSADNVLDHVLVEQGGASAPSYGLKANLNVVSSSSKPVRLTLTNSTVKGSDGYGVFISRLATIPAFAGNTITQNTLGAAFVGADAVGQLDKTTSFKGNTVEMVWVDAAGGLTKSQTWPALDVQYVVDGVLAVNQAPGVRLTLEAGAKLAFRVSSGIQVGTDGGLIAKGTAAAPITFTRASTADAWRGLNFHNSNTTDNELDHAVVEGAGSSAYNYGDKANVSVTSSSSLPSRLTLTNSMVRDSLGWGAWVWKAGNLTESGNTYSGNASGNVYTKP